MRSLLLFLVLGLSQGCAFIGYAAMLNPQARCEMRYRDQRYDNSRYVSFNFVKTTTTPSGIVVSDPHPSPERNRLIDRAFDQYERCLGRKVYRCGIRVMIVPETEVCAKHPELQMFRCLGHMSADCPGLCTGTNEWPDIIVTTPDLRSILHELGHRTEHYDDGNPFFDRCGVPFVPESPGMADAMVARYVRIAGL